MAGVKKTLLLNEKTMSDVKNLVNDTTIYKKQNSFDHLKVKKEIYEDVISNIARLEQELDQKVKDEYRKEILKRLFNDLKTNESNVDDKVFTLKPNVLEELSRIEYDNYARYLFYRYRYEIFPNTKELDDFPPCVQVEPTSICNFKCVFCYQTDKEFNNPKGEHMGNMPLDMFKKIIDELEGNVESITLASRGEPLVHKSIGEMLEYMNGKFLASKLNTNASLLTEKRCHQILSSDIQTLVYSADAAEEPLYSELRVGGSLERVLKNVKMFYDIKNKHYPDSKIITRVSGVKVNSDQDINLMNDFWGEYVDQVAFVNYNPWENTYLRSESHVSTPCSDLWRRTFIWFDGIMNPCDVDYKSHLRVGNIQDINVSKNWLSDSYNQMRQKHLQDKRDSIFPCNRCTVI